MSYVPHNVLITGGCGFIGSNVLNFLFRAWPNVNFINYDKLILNADACNIDEEIRNSNRYKLVTADIRNRDVMIHVLKAHQIDTVIHFAADCTSTRCYNDPCESIENNVVAFVEFLESIREYAGVKRFVHISTDEVYGDSSVDDDNDKKDENSLLIPNNPYAATKAAAENYVHLYRHMFNLPILMLRINNIYGPNQWNVKVVPRFIEIAKNCGKYTIQGSGKQLRSWLFVDDAANGIRIAVEKGVLGEVYNLGSYFEMNMLDLAKVIQAEVDRQLGREPHTVEYVFVPDRPYNDLRYLLDITKASTQLGWNPETPFEDGIRRVVSSALKEKSSSIPMSVLVVGGGGYIGQHIQKLLTARKIPFHVTKCKVGVDDDQNVIDELNRLRGTHVICCTGRTHGGSIKTIEYLEGGPDKVYQNVRDNLYSAVALAHICSRLGLHYTYVGTGYLFKYNAEHPIGGKGYSENG
ncbi:hypothetical protein AB6A40_005050 [Gnathostoma spinigerum]|uniref:dTDP-D-glucose 4,6-dehydratase n=1 Tax=Gnathostoma spinigerum TaxID=75299 RepID=A0ABD6ELP1_9BILA